MPQLQIKKKSPSFFFFKSCVASLFGFPKCTSDIQPWSVPVTLGSILGGCYTSCPQCVLSNTHTHMIATSELCWTEPVTRVCEFRSHRTWKCFDWCNYSWGVRVRSAPHIHIHCLDFSARKQAQSEHTWDDGSVSGRLRHLDQVLQIPVYGSMEPKY